MILLEEAVARFNTAGRLYGVALRPWRSLRRPRQLLADVESAIDPLRLPDELKHFWATYDPSTICEPALNGFIPLEFAVERREIDCPPAPQVLMPIADWGPSRVFIELETDNHPGGRIFHGYHDETEVSLWAFGVSGLLDVLSEAFEADLLDDRSGTLDHRAVHRLIHTRLDESLEPSIPRHFEAVDRSRFSSHWQFAEGLAFDYYELRGATHSVAALEDERHRATKVTATLVGTFRATIGGGPLGGTMGVLSDESGSVQVFVPQSTAVAGAIGPTGEVEMDVFAVPVVGADLDSIEGHRELQQAVRSGSAFDERAMVDRLFSQLHDLDMSIVATALRPIRP